MKKILIGLLPLLMLSCNPKGAEQQNGGQDQGTEARESVIRTLPDYHLTAAVDTVGHHYEYTVDRVANDSLGTVTDDLGDQHANTVLTISVSKDGNRLFSHSFTKKSFGGIVGDEILKNSILDGCRFLEVKGGNVLFVLCVSYPESDMYQPLLLKIAPDGSYNIELDESLADLEEEDGV